LVVVNSGVINEFKIADPYYRSIGDGAMRIALKVQGLRKTFRVKSGRLVQTIEAVRGVSFEVNNGEVFTLLGPSGCGKTTTLRCIAGLEDPDDGEIEIDGLTVFSRSRSVSVPPEKRGVGMVFQNYSIWPHMNVFENVAYPLRARRMPRDEVVRRVRWALSLVKLEGMENRPATKLSGGQQQRVALARALISEPKALLLDEPLSNLDARVRERLRDELRSLLRSLDVATVYVTHDQLEAFVISDRIGLMNEGELLETGDPIQLYFKPKTKFGAEFLGSANVIEGEARPDGTIETQIGKIVVEPSDPDIVDGKVYVVFRAESVRLDPTGECANTPNSFKGIVLERKFLGDKWELSVDVNGVSIRVSVPSGLDIRTGSRVCVQIDSATCSLVRR
jgi:iron(III) transport system ATP-binding protein